MQDEEEAKLFNSFVDDRILAKQLRTSYNLVRLLGNTSSLIISELKRLGREANSKWLSVYLNPNKSPTNIFETQDIVHNIVSFLPVVQKDIFNSYTKLNGIWADNTLRTLTHINFFDELIHQKNIILDNVEKITLNNVADLKIIYLNNIKLPRLENIRIVEKFKFPDAASLNQLDFMGLRGPWETVIDRFLWEFHRLIDGKQIILSCYDSDTKLIKIFGKLALESPQRFGLPPNIKATETFRQMDHKFAVTHAKRKKREDEMIQKSKK